jgi:hypothetical protein
MDTRGNLYNFYNDIDGERKITPVGNVSELQSFKVSKTRWSLKPFKVRKT